MKTVNFSLQIQSGNEAFQGAYRAELARILAQLADKLRQPAIDVKPPKINSLTEVADLKDINGNKVGAYCLVISEEE